ncbi:MAG: sulfatase [Candidatus Omnitrophica bacterium]|nr:sulfatase [Candidatus Omnitrophota bacterium]
MRFRPPHLALLILLTMGSTALAEPSSRPNILFAIADDWSWPHAGAYGDQVALTPNFDRVAERGVLFHNAFCVAPQCSPNRASILTGRNIWENEEAGTHASSFPTKFTVYPGILAKAGYFTGFTGKPWGPGVWEEAGWPQNPAGKEFEPYQLDNLPEGVNSTDYARNFEAFLDACPEDAPFCFWYGCHEPHRKFEQGIGAKNGIDPDSVHVPAFLPDLPLIRSDLADYYYEVQWFDRHLGKMLDLLEERGELDNTLVVVTSDNGMAFPRAKANLYEYGLHMPLAVMWPEKVSGGREVQDLISFTDFAPTFLEAAGLPSEPAMTGRSFLDLLTTKEEGIVDPSRKFVLSGRERHTHARPDNRGYPARSIRTQDYLLIWNLNPDLWPAGNDLGPEGFYDIDGCPSKTFLLENRDDPEIKKYFDWAVARRPEFELFDIRKDPECLENLADDPIFESIRKDLHGKLEFLLISQKDPRVTGRFDLFDSYPRYSGMREFMGGFVERGKYNPAFQTGN